MRGKRSSPTRLQSTGLFKLGVDTIFPFIMNEAMFRMIVRYYPASVVRALFDKQIKRTVNTGPKLSPEADKPKEHDIAKYLEDQW